MAESVEKNAAIYKKHTYKYIAPTPPSNLIDSTTIVIDFNERKFINIGMNPVDKFNVVVHIITPSRYISISPEILTNIFTLMGTIFSFILETPDKSKNIILFADDTIKLSIMVYRGQNVLVIESFIVNGCRVLLNRSDLMVIQSMEWLIFETTARKSNIIRPMILQQVDQMAEYLKKRDNMIQKNNWITKENLLYTIKNDVSNENFIENMPKHEHCYIIQLRTYAAEQIVQKWISKIIEPTESYDVCGIKTMPMEHYSPPTTPLDYYSPPSPVKIENKPLLNFVYEPQSCYSPVSSPSYPEQSENDGPSFYDLIHVPSSPPLVSPTDSPPKRAEQTKYVYPGQSKRVKRKTLFENMLFDE